MCYLGESRGKLQIQTRGGGGGRTRLLKFKFSAKFSHAILQLQIKTFKIA